MPMAIHQSCVVKSRFREINFSVKKKNLPSQQKSPLLTLFFLSSNFF